MEFDFSINPDEAHKHALAQAVKFLQSKNDRGFGRLCASVLFNRNESAQAVLNSIRKENLVLLGTEIMEMLAARGLIVNPFFDRWYKAQLEALFDSANENVCRELSELFKFEGTVQARVDFKIYPHNVNDPNDGPAQYLITIARNFVSFKYTDPLLRRSYLSERVYLGTAREELVLRRVVE